MKEVWGAELVLCPVLEAGHEADSARRTCVSDHPLQKCRAELMTARLSILASAMPHGITTPDGWAGYMAKERAKALTSALRHLEAWGDSAVGLDKWEDGEPRYCCNAFDCDCRGMPIDPPWWAEALGLALQDPASHIEAALASLSIGGELAEAWREYESELFSAMYFDDIFEAKKLKSTRAYNLTRAHLLAAAGNSKGEV